MTAITEKYRLPILLLLHCILFAASVYPLTLAHVLPLADYPNHLARTFIIYNEKRLPVIDNMYDVHWEIAPYLAMEFLLPLFQHVTDVYTAGKYFIVLNFFLIVTGVVMLSREVNKYPSYSTLLVYPFLYNLTLLWGFINFIFGLGVALISFALFLRFRKKITWVRAVGLMLLLTANYFAHAISYGILCLTILLYELVSYNWRNNPDWKAFLTRLAILGFAILPQIILWPFAPKNISRFGLEFGGVVSFVNKFGSPVFFVHSLSELLILLLTVMLICMSVLRLEKRLLFVSIALAIISLFTPLRLFGIYLTNIRLPAFLAFLVIGTSHIDFERVNKRIWLYGGISLLLLACVAERYVAIIGNIRSCGAMIDEFRTDLNEGILDQGVPVLTMIDNETSACPYGFNHINSLLTIESHVFIPEIFTIIPPVKATAAFEKLDSGIRDVPQAKDYFAPVNENKYDHKDDNHYKYFVLINKGEGQYTIPASWQLAGQGSFFQLYVNTLFDGNW